MSSLTAVIADVCRAVRAHTEELNTLDAHAGDGDLGVTMTIAATAVEELLPTPESLDAAAVLRECGTTIAGKAPSTSGTLIATGLLRASAALAADPQASLATCLAAAQAGIAERGGAQLGSKTMLDALAPAAAACGRDTDIAVAAAHAAAAAIKGARETTTMTPEHGRAGWLAERSMGHEDAGARLIVVILEAIAQSVAEPQTA